MTKYKCYNLGETKEFLGMCISYNCKNQKIFVNQSEYLDKVLVYFNMETNLTSTLLLLNYALKLNDKQYNSSFCQKY